VVQGHLEEAAAVAEAMDGGHEPILEWAL
jgi:hypothetical protein